MSPNSCIKEEVANVEPGSTTERLTEDQRVNRQCCGGFCARFRDPGEEYRLMLSNRSRMRRQSRSSAGSERVPALAST